MARPRWRSVVATWGGAAWLVMQQFGVPAAARVVRGPEIVRVEEAARALEAAERLPDGRILTVPAAVSAGRSRQDASGHSSVRFSAN